MASEYTAEVVADLQAMVVGGLACWNLSPVTAVTLLNVSENATFALSDPVSGRELVLRVHRVGYSSSEEIRSELAWINALCSDAVIETAAPIPSRDGNLVRTLQSPSGQPPRFAVAFDRLPGKAPEAGSEAVSWFERLGELTARLHLHARSWRRPADFRRRRWDIDAMVGPNGCWGSWHLAPGLDQPGTRAIERALTLIARRIGEFGVGPERFGLVHADLRLANLLVCGDRLHIIDFDDCGFSWFLYDFAGAVSFIEHEPIMPQLLQAWIGGYRQVAPLSREECAEIPTFVILRRILLTAWLASHAEIPFAREFGPSYTAGTVALAESFERGRFLAYS